MGHIVVIMKYKWELTDVLLSVVSSNDREWR